MESQTKALIEQLYIAIDNDDGVTISQLLSENDALVFDVRRLHQILGFAKAFMLDNAYESLRPYAMENAHIAFSLDDHLDIAHECQSNVILDILHKRTPKYFDLTIDTKLNHCSHYYVDAALWFVANINDNTLINILRNVRTSEQFSFFSGALLPNSQLPFADTEMAMSVFHRITDMYLSDNIYTKHLLIYIFKFALLLYPHYPEEACARLKMILDAHTKKDSHFYKLVSDIFVDNARYNEHRQADFTGAFATVIDVLANDTEGNVNTDILMSNAANLFERYHTNPSVDFEPSGFLALSRAFFNLPKGPEAFLKHTHSTLVIGYFKPEFLLSLAEVTNEAMALVSPETRSQRANALQEYLTRWLIIDAEESVETSLDAFFALADAASIPPRSEINISDINNELDNREGCFYALWTLLTHPSNIPFFSHDFKHHYYTIMAITHRLGGVQPAMEKAKEHGNPEIFKEMLDYLVS